VLAAYAQQVIRSESRLVTVPVVVLDANGAYVAGLIITDTGADLHSQYVLSFTPPNDVARGLHSIEVHVKGGERYRVRARRAYWVAE
jgi:hypothetical protein